MALTITKTTNGFFVLQSNNQKNGCMRPRATVFNNDYIRFRNFFGEDMEENVRYSDIMIEAESNFTSVESVMDKLIEVGFLGAPEQEPTTYYVRPAGSSYGTGDGLSYANAWSGKANINNALIADNRLAICGTHSEFFSFDGINTHIIGNDVNESGIISCNDTLLIGLRVLNSTSFKITGLSVIDAVVSCIEFDNVTGYTKDCVVTGCGNQGLQHLHSFNMVHENLTAHDNIDDGISGHEGGYIKVIGGSFKNNEAGINVIDDVVVEIEGSPVFENNLYDIWAANATSPGSCVIRANGCTFPNQVLSSNKANVILNNCNATSILVQTESGNKSYVEAFRSIIGNLHVGSSNATLTNCRVNDITTISAGGIVEAIGCYIKPVGVFDINGTLRAVRCFFDGVDCTDHTIDCNSAGTLKLQYCILTNTISGKYAISIRTGSSIEALEALTLYGSSAGRGIYTQISVTVKNTIITGLSQGVMSVTAGQTLTLENCTLFNNTTNITGSGTTVQNDSVNNNPLFKDVSINDFSLLSGSTLLNSGESLSNNQGFFTVNWGDSTTVPVIVTKTLTSFNIGAI